MRKYIFWSVAVFAVAVAVAFNAGLNSQNDKLSDVSLANVEALADGEGSAFEGWVCFNSVTEGYVFELGASVIDCSGCHLKWVTHASWSGRCFMN